MFEVTEKPLIVERAYLVGIQTPTDTATDALEHFQELEQLVKTMGVPVVGSEIIALKEFKSRLLIGKGKAEWIEAELRRLDADCLIFDENLSPSQQRNWEKMLDNICVIDRQEVILDIFADRAQTPEARLQIKLARNEYSLPRLKRLWTHLERQRNAQGARGGMGEKQIEADRRIVNDQITKIKRELQEVRKRRHTQRKQRGLRPMPVAAIVGYTNAGKSSLLNKMTDASVLAEDKLFATLDPTTRRITLPDNQEMLLSDTVGFIRKLPHNLIESFKATLEEVQLADLLIHVVDASHPNAADHIKATNTVLQELDAFDKPTILTLNKIDALEDREKINNITKDAEHFVALSAHTGEGISSLLEKLQELNPDQVEQVILEIPQSRYDIVSLIHREGDIQQEHHTGSSIWLKVKFPERLQHKLNEFVQKEFPEAI